MYLSDLKPDGQVKGRNHQKLLQLRKKTISKKMISLIKSNDTETNENDKIVNEVKTFYSQL